MPSPICVQCQLVMRCEKNDRLVNDVRAGDLPATYWLGDLFKCPKCHTEIMVGFSREYDELEMLQLRKNGIADHDSLAFARDLPQLDKFASQFKKEPSDA